MQDKLEAVVPDSIDRGEKPFVKPFMVELADDHYELDISRAQALLGWAPRHALLNILLAVALMFAPFMFDGGSLVADLADLAGVVAGLLLIALSIPRGRIDSSYGSWSRYLV